MGKTFGLMGVDWEQRVDLDRLRRERLERISLLLEQSEMGALLCFDMGNIRYITATHIGTWAMDKLARFTPAGARPPADRVGLRLGRAPPRAVLPVAGGPHAGRHLDHARGDVAGERPRRGRRRQGPPRARAPRPGRRAAGGGRGRARRCCSRCRRPASQVVDGQQLMQRGAGDQDAGRDRAARHRLHDGRRGLRGAVPQMRPGMRENECVGLVSKVLYDLGSEHVEGVNAISGERANPHPHVYSDRVLRPGDPAYFDILHSHMGYRTCYYRTFAVGSASRAQVDAYRRCRDLLDRAIAVVRPGATTAEVASVWPRAQEFGFAERGGGVRAPVRARRRPLDLGEADHQPAGVARPPRADRAGHGVRAGDVLAGLGRLVGGPHRGAAGGHRRPAAR